MVQIKHNLAQYRTYIEIDIFRREVLTNKFFKFFIKFDFTYKTRNSYGWSLIFSSDEEFWLFSSPHPLFGREAVTDEFVKIFLGKEFLRMSSYNTYMDDISMMVTFFYPLNSRSSLKLEILLYTRSSSGWVLTP